MRLFISTYTNKVDAKGRASVPSSFRDVLKAKELSSVVLFRSFTNNCLEGCGADYISDLHDSIESNLDEFSEEKEALSVAVFGGSIELSIDGDGRIVLPKNLLDEVGINSQIVFVGKGKTFQIWNPDDYQVFQKRALEVARKTQTENPKLRLAARKDNV